MHVFRFHPISHQINDLTTSGNVENQLWQELTFLRHCNTNNEESLNSFSPWIDQAKTYYQDGMNNNWKSAGLLYYYSFLNLAKALISKNGVISSERMKSTSIYHGITAEPQEHDSILDYTMNLKQTEVKGKRNIFATLYEVITGELWPFNESIDIRLSDILPYCSDVAHESFVFYKIRCKNIRARSLLIEENNKRHLEVLMNLNEIDLFSNSLRRMVDNEYTYHEMSNEMKVRWRETYNVQEDHLIAGIILQMKESEDYGIGAYAKYVKEQLKGIVLPSPSNSGGSADFWTFKPEINLKGKEFSWHPLLSSYLFSFMLSNILRYHPHVFQSDTKDSFIAEAFCTQGQITTLRYFLMSFTLPNSTRLN